MPESFEDQLSRVEGMSRGDPTWDLSPNDQAALKAVLRDRIRLWHLVERAIAGLKNIGEFRYESGDEPHSLDCTLAGRVSRVFCTGMTRAIELCREFGENPEHSEAAERHAAEREQREHAATHDGSGRECSK